VKERNLRMVDSDTLQGSADEPTVWVREWWKEPDTDAKYRVSALEDVHWDDAHDWSYREPLMLVHAYVWCNAMLEGSLLHSCTPGDAPHRLKVCVTERRNAWAVMEQLKEAAAPIPASPRRLAWEERNRASEAYREELKRAEAQKAQQARETAEALAAAKAATKAATKAAATQKALEAAEAKVRGLEAGWAKARCRAGGSAQDDGAHERFVRAKYQLEELRRLPLDGDQRLVQSHLNRLGDDVPVSMFLSRN